MDSPSKKNIKSILVLTGLALHLTAVSARAETEEDRLIRIARDLHHISNSQWNEIAGSKTAEIYEVQKGDTLWGVSKHLFGNPNYWPKVWSLNKKIPNPHVLNPGTSLVFMPGSSDAAPSLGTADSFHDEPASRYSSAPIEPSNKRRKEYEKVATDRWTPVNYADALAKNYDDYGLDKELKVRIPSRFVFRVPAIASDIEIPHLGEITSSLREGVGISTGDTVFLSSEHQDLQVGSTYSILGEPEHVFDRDKKTDRSAYMYRSLGEIRVIGIKDNLYVGVVSAAYDVIKRGDRLYTLLPLITDIKPIPAEPDIEALVMPAGRFDTQNIAQFNFVHLDRGLQDRVRVGNVFRLYTYYDPTTKSKVTDSDFIFSADAIVVHATAQFSTALIIRSRSTVDRGDFGVSLVDVSDLEKKNKDRSHELNDSQTRSTFEDKELDELDELDRNSGEGLGKKEEVEIKELDHWDKSKDAPPPHQEAAPSDSAAPHEEPTLPGESTTSETQEPTLETPSLKHDPTIDENLDSPTITSPETPTTPGETLPSETESATPTDPNDAQISPDAQTPDEQAQEQQPVQPTSPDNLELQPIE